MHPQTSLKEIDLENELLSLSVMKFSDQTLITISDNGTFGAFHEVDISELRPGKEPVVTIKPIFGSSDQYAQVDEVNIYIGGVCCILYAPWEIYNTN